MPSFKKKIYKVNDSSLFWEHRIEVPQDVWSQLVETGTRVVCTFNGEVKHQCALMHNGQGGYFINLNKQLLKQLKSGEGDELSIEIENDTSKYGLPMPEEFEELLKQDQLGDAYFHGLTKGHQRNLLRIIGQPKGSETRLKKAVVVINYLKETEGVLDYKALNVAFKEANKR